MRLVVTALAEIDFEQIYDLNAQRSDDWADRVQRCLLERAKALLVTPQMGRAVGREGSRRLSVPDIQYVIDYEIKDDAVRILMVRSTREMR